MLLKHFPNFEGLKLQGRVVKIATGLLSHVVRNIELKTEAAAMSVGFVIKKLLDPCSILELALRRCVLGKDILRLLPTKVTVAKPDKRLTNRTQKRLDRRNKVLGLNERRRQIKKETLAASAAQPY